MLSGTITVNSVRQREAPSAAEASRRLGSSRDITLISGSSISGISIWVSEITRPSSVCSSAQRLGDDAEAASAAG